MNKSKPTCRYRLARLARLAALSLTLSFALSIVSAMTHQNAVAAERRPNSGLARSGSALDSPEQANERQALEHYLLGLELKNENKFEAALRHFESALALDPFSYTIRLTLINTYAKLGRYEDARREGLLLEPRDAEALRMIIDLYRQAEYTDSVVYFLKQLATLDSSDQTSRRWLMTFFERTGQPDSALRYHSELANLTQEYRTYNDLGSAYFQSGDMQQARGAFQKSLELEKGRENIPGYTGLIDVFSRLDKSEEERKYLSELLALDSSYVPTHRRFMDYHARRGNFDSALVFAKMEVAAIPEDHGAIRRLGIIAYNTDSLDLSAEQFNTLIAIGEVDMTNHFFLGRIFLRQKNYLYSLLNFRKTVALADSLADGWLGMAQVYQALDSTVALERTYQQAALTVKDDDERIRLYFSLGSLRERDGRIKKSIEAFEEALKIDPDHAPTLNYLGYMLIERNERVGYAKDMVGRALVSAPNNSAYLDSYAWALYQEGDFQGCLDSLRRAMEQMNPDPTIYDHVGDTFKMLNVPDSAAIYWERALELDSTNTEIKQKLEQ